MGTHYSIGQETKNLAKWAKSMATQLIKEQTKGTLLVLCYAGMSGTALTTALSLEYSRKAKSFFGMCYIRKAGETSHSCGSYEFHGPAKLAKKQKVVLCFIDDFVDSGNTRTRVLRNAKRFLTEDHEYIIAPHFFQIFQNGTRFQKRSMKNFSEEVD